MAKFVCSALLALAALAGASPSARAQFVPGNAGEAVCDLTRGGGIITVQDGGLFPIGPASCGLDLAASGSIAVQPSASLQAVADAACSIRAMGRPPKSSWRCSTPSR